MTPEVQHHCISMAPHATAHSCESALACPSFNDIVRSNHSHINTNSNINNDHTFDGPATSGLPSYRVNA